VRGEWLGRKRREISGEGVGDEEGRGEEGRHSLGKITFS